MKKNRHKVRRPAVYAKLRRRGVPVKAARKAANRRK